MQIEYKQTGEVLLPMIETDSHIMPSGRYARMRLKYLKNHKKVTYAQMKLTGKLMQHLSDIQKEAERMNETITENLMKSDPPPEKEYYPLEWTGHMNRIKHQVEETIQTHLLHS